jgi:anthranilate synthase component I
MLKEFTQDTPTHTTIVRELPADLETPVSVYLKLAGNGPSFLLESVTGGEQVARYSFIGVRPRVVYVLRGRSLETHTLEKEVEMGTSQMGTVGADGYIQPPPSQITNLPEDADPLDALRAQIAPQMVTDPAQRIPGLPRFAGGLVGYLGYDTVRFFEPTVHLHPHRHLPDAIFLHADTLVAFDHAYGKLILIANAPTRVEAEDQLDDLETSLSTPLSSLPSSPLPLFPASQLRSNMTREQYTAAVRAAKEHIAAGDIFQVVPSQRFSRETTAQPFEIYRTLRRLNPSPYMFFFDFENLAGDEPMHLIGASPEMHVRYSDGVASLRPIAGTRRRGDTPAEDAELQRELLGDPKERAEHVMLVDLARNDLGRVCKYGTVRVCEQMVVERYSHVMHIVSHIDGELRPGLDAFDLVRATFPAGTVSGAPKVRAMQIIHDLEPEPRGAYAGAVGYFGYDGNADTCIAIRTLVMQGQTVHIQAGAGIVADSDPELEYEETVNKAKAISVAIELAEKSSHKPPSFQEFQRVPIMMGTP